MVRSNTPLPFMFRLRNQASGVCRRAFSGRTMTAALLAPPTFERRRPGLGASQASSAPAAWREFLDRYEQFTDVLCVAAKSGCDDHLESKYAVLRRWFMEHYYRVAPRLRPYLEAEGNPLDLPLPHVLDQSTGLRRPMDAFEAIFMPKTLSEVLNSDQGDLISRVSHVSSAVYRCDAGMQTGIV